MNRITTNYKIVYKSIPILVCTILPTNTHLYTLFFKTVCSFMREIKKNCLKLSAITVNFRQQLEEKLILKKEENHFFLFN